MLFSILLFPDNIKAQKDSNSLLRLNHVHMTEQSLNTNKQLERKALKSSAVVHFLRAYDHKAARKRNTNLRSLNRSLAKQRLPLALLFCQILLIGILISLPCSAFVVTFTVLPKCNKSLQQVSRDVRVCTVSLSVRALGGGSQYSLKARITKS